MCGLLHLPDLDEQLVQDDSLELQDLCLALLLHIGQELCGCEILATLFWAHDGSLDSLSHPLLTSCLDCWLWGSLPPAILCLAWLSILACLASCRHCC